STNLSFDNENNWTACLIRYAFVQSDILCRHMYDSGIMVYPSYSPTLALCNWDSFSDIILSFIYL
ncbi:MAG: hypothetical protein Q9P01_13295, partial [Anaerolineae bacterium]|nr:hypothetical protein [Anaerolineae bacterium]